ncbi:hypothetical protein PYW08_006841 [Mythimna loreyi]|uniref:Uncharacterized protein n=1 Tax=Mythimna loreyi TaxID=667449 RepID=A0ACC2R816_9NEOP|nr:hypothetical protein PYW08_006841 [Mythimna loreyi]
MAAFGVAARRRHPLRSNALKGSWRRSRSKLAASSRAFQGNALRHASSAAVRARCVSGPQVLSSVSVLVSNRVDAVSVNSHGESRCGPNRVIDEVRLRKQLWDAYDPLYKNKDARNKSWDDIVFALFENVSEGEKRLGSDRDSVWRIIINF